MINYNKRTINIMSLIISAIVFGIILFSIQACSNNQKTSYNQCIKQNNVGEIAKKNWHIASIQVIINKYVKTSYILIKPNLVRYKGDKNEKE